MENYIRYKRVKKEILDRSDTIQEFLNEFVVEGMDIIFYHEEIMRANTDYLIITIVAGKRQSKLE
jgi:hypothetical protein